MCPFGNATTRRPSAARRTGTITMVSSPRTTTPPAEDSRSPAGRRRWSIEIPAERHRVVDGEPAAALRDDAGALERRQEAAGRLPAGARELGEGRGGCRDERVGGAGALGLDLLGELAEDGRHAALDGLEALARESLV